MVWLNVTILWSLAILFTAVTSTQQPLVDGPFSTNQKSVAIIGAGISGASVAFELQERARPSLYDVTLFERESRVGGHIKSVPLPQTPRVTIETGSMHFYDDDWCLNQAIKDVGLSIAGPDFDPVPRTTGVWNGRYLWESPTCDSKATWEELWKYGMSPWKYHRSIQDVSRRWNSFTTGRFVSNLTEDLEDVALRDLVSQSATQYVNETGISPRYSSDFIDSCIRTRFMQELVQAHAFTAVMAAQQRRTGPIQGGNYRLVERLVKLSDSKLRLNTTVTEIGRGQDRRYRVKYTDRSSPNVLKYQEFDNIVLAAPLHNADIDFGGLSTLDRSAVPQYSDIHITHFLTPSRLSSLFFNLSKETPMTDDVLVTENASRTHGIYAISRSVKCWIDEEGCEPWMSCDELICENMYRVVTGEAIGDRDVIGMIGGRYEEDKLLEDQNIRWIHRQPWPAAIPVYQPTSGLLEQVQLAPGLFYLGAGEGIVSSMEMSCRIGKSIAGRIYYGY